MTAAAGPQSLSFFGMPSLWKRITASHINFVTTGYVRLVEPVAMAFVRAGVSANTLTTLGTISTIAGGVAFGTGHIRVGGIIVALTAAADAMDGIVARATGKASVFGAFYDSTLDRVADGALLGGIAYFFATSPAHRSVPMLVMSLIGIVGTFLVSYTRARADALGIDAKVGVMQRAERVALLAVPQAFFGLALDGWVLTGVVCILTVTAWMTAIQRITFVRRSALGRYSPSPEQT